MCMPTILHVILHYTLSKQCEKQNEQGQLTLCVYTAGPVYVCIGEVIKQTRMWSGSEDTGRGKKTIAVSL